MESSEIRHVGLNIRSTFGLLAADVVVMVYTDRPKGAHVISVRKAEKHEARYYRQVAKENLG